MKITILNLFLPIVIFADTVVAFEDIQGFHERDELARGRCGPSHSNRVCDCSGGNIYCNQGNGWCGTSSYANQNVKGDRYDCTNPPVSSPCTLGRLDIVETNENSLRKVRHHRHQDVPLLAVEKKHTEHTKHHTTEKKYHDDEPSSSNGHWDFSQWALETNFVKLQGKGYCVGSDGKDSQAKFYRQVTSREQAATLCENTNNCIAFSYNSGGKSVFYVDGVTCEYDCGKIDWRLNRNLIRAAGGDYSCSPQYECWVKDFEYVQKGKCPNGTPMVYATMYSNNHQALYGKNRKPSEWDGSGSSRVDTGGCMEACRQKGCTQISHTWNENCVMYSGGFCEVDGSAYRQNWEFYERVYTKPPPPPPPHYCPQNPDCPPRPQCPNINYKAGINHMRDIVIMATCRQGEVDYDRKNRCCLGVPPPVFDPSSRHVTYHDHGSCGARGDDAKADMSDCRNGHTLVLEMKFKDWGKFIIQDGCKYWSYKVYQCLGVLPSVFNPSSRHVKYHDQGGCGPRGDDAKADMNDCKNGYTLESEMKFTAWDSFIVKDGCKYWSYKVYRCK